MRPLRPIPPRRQARSQAGAVCSTCKRCRLKKVKCDGQRPKCGVCCLKNQPCEYPPDGRKTAVRAKKEDVELLQKEIQELRQEARGTSSAEAVIEGNHHSVHVGFVLSNHPGSRLDYTLSGQRSDAPPWDSQKHSKISEIQAYGATSLLHRYIGSSSAGTESREVEHDASRNHIRDQLISFSAISRQKENMLYYTPSIAANIDFDGVPMDTAMHLLDLHWNRLHLMYLLSYRPAFMDSLLNNGPYVNKLLMNAIYIQSCLYSDRTSLHPDTDNARSSGMAFYDRFKSLLADYIDKPTMPTVVALLLCGACLVQYGKQSAGWVFCGMAYRMIFDLGYHLEDQKPSHGEGDVRLSPVEQEMRRRVYWGAYATDKFQSLYLGQNPALTLFQGNVPREFYDSFEELEEWRPYIDLSVHHLSNIDASVYPGRPSFALSTFECLLQLSVITESVIGAFYSTASRVPQLHSLLETRKQITMELNEWRARVPSHLAFDPDTDDTPPPPHQMTLFTTYWTLVILTEQQFTTQSRFGHNIHESVQTEAQNKCVDAAFRIRALAGAYRRAFTLRRAQFGISYAMYSAVLILLQHRAAAASRSQDRDAYTEACRFFWAALLEYQRGCGSGLKKPMALLKSLVLRVEELAPFITDETSEGAITWSSLHGQFGTADIGTEAAPGMITLGEDQSRANDEGSQYPFLVDDTIFGFFTDGAVDLS
ncbi:fungal-specific transcription factor domain-containing protein [Aspergillus pseudoustus]|uniref:Fungal-specific transcription factor domain-containing protein n=1 Tax=Aspergillus pseudoustus TaxID=1810923 RepID=A0ABR4ID58_9EURO